MGRESFILYFLLCTSIDSGSDSGVETIGRMTFICVHGPANIWILTIWIYIILCFLFFVKLKFDVIIDNSTIKFTVFYVNSINVKNSTKSYYPRAVSRTSDTTLRRKINYFVFNCFCRIHVEHGDVRPLHVFKQCQYEY